MEAEGRAIGCLEAKLPEKYAFRALIGSCFSDHPSMRCVLFGWLARIIISEVLQTIANFAATSCAASINDVNFGGPHLGVPAGIMSSIH